MALVHLPPDAGPEAAPLRRPKFALRMRSQMAESAVRSLGIDATECSMLFRMNSRFVATGSGGGSLELKPQMHLACRF
jgi:hypothetical protein